MKGDQILSVCLDITTHLCLHLAEGGSCDRGEGNVRDIIHGETNQTVKGVFHKGLKLTNVFKLLFNVHPLFCSWSCQTQFLLWRRQFRNWTAWKRAKKWVKLQIQTRRWRKKTLNVVNKYLNTDRPSVPLTGDEHQPRVGGVS